MKSNILLGSLLVLGLTSCVGSVSTESKKVISERKNIMPEGYNRGLPFTPGILVDGTLYVAGFSGEDPKTGVILKEADMDYKDVVSVQVYLTDMELFERMNVVYRTYFNEPRPTRSIMGIKSLIGPARIEITVTARK